MTPVIELTACSKWYGHVLGISDISWSVTGGVVGLLGPNGAGKSTLMKLMAGLAAPSRGDVRLFGEDPRRTPAVRGRLGYCPEHEKSYDRLSALEFVTVMAQLSGLGASSKKLARESLVTMGLEDALHRRLGGFSKGMRQRTKLAQCLVHDPELIILDEPLTGVDPLARAEITERIAALGKAGKTVVISSHVLYEIEALTTEIVVIYRGQVLAEGNVFEIRKLIDKHPHRIRVECDDPRALGARLSTAEHVVEVHFEKNALVVLTHNPDACYDLLGRQIAEKGLAVRSLSSPDNNLGAVFDYLTGGRG